ncbi:MAG: cytoplasmic protein [Candidatus Omnitrophica bacterium]|nr:cytoplasmic protein [Candidatus Omnitrophota bacterium]
MWFIPEENDNQQRQFERMSATYLYCPNCKRSMPVREILLLVLPDGELYDYRCVNCNESLGTKQETNRRSL